ncbi:hypothetical protein F4810DRAFT_399273 [Camillea tinctor]|nr:hypothetical protein F4810DRAFT_399273 [Camillea tinctor]
MAWASSYDRIWSKITQFTDLRSHSHVLYKMATNKALCPVVLDKITILNPSEISSKANIGLSSAFDSMKRDVVETSTGSQTPASQRTRAIEPCHHTSSCTMNSSETREIWQRSITENSRPTIDNILDPTTRAGSVGLSITLAPKTKEIKPAPTLNLTETSEIAYYQNRSSLSAHLLEVPGLYREYNKNIPIKGSVNKWTLLNRPQNKPGVPTISVTDPMGVVKYPHDHTYYFNDSEGDDDSDVYD